MKHVKFYKVSFEQFKKDWIDTFYNGDTLRDVDNGELESKIREIYNNIKLPERSTIGSSGYDFFSPSEFNLVFNTNIKIPTGIKAEIAHGYTMLMFPRSSWGFKYGIELSNSTGVIDEDYFDNEDNEGHIQCKLVNKDQTEGKDLKIGVNDKYCQGIIVQYGTSEDDNVTSVRVGGIGSTGK